MFGGIAFLCMIVYEQFFALLRAGLYPDLHLDLYLFPVGHTDWNTLFRLAKQQAVTGITFDGLSKLPVEYQPDVKLKMQWYSFVVRIEQSNELVNDRLCSLFSLYKSRGLNPVLLKGQGVAQNYPIPLHRQCGDIDIYVGTQDFDKSNCIAHELDIRDYEEGITEHHSHFKWQGVDVENHRIPAVLFGRKLIRAFNKHLKEWYPGLSQTAVIHTSDIAVPPAAFDAVFLFLHFYTHFVLNGVGIRQVCDWVMLLHKHRPFVTDVLGFDMEWQTFGYIAVRYLGLPEKEMPYYTDKYSDKAKRVIELILKDGNFGKNNTSAFLDRPQGYWSGKLFSFKYVLQRLWKMLRIFPSSSLQYFFGYKLKISIGTILKDKL